MSNALTVVLAWLDVAMNNESPGGADALGIAMRRARDGQRIARKAIGADPADVDDTMPLGHLLREAITGVTPLASSRGVTLELEIEHPEATVTSAPDALQILTNLLLNAISFTPTGRKVVLAAHSTRAGLVASVQDEGPGIPDTRRSQVFARGRSTRSGGAGIGLVHALAMARHHGGDLSLQPFVDGAGARFELTWPSRLPRRSSAPPPMPTGKRLDGSRVLVIEDDPMLVLLLEAALAARGAEVTCASRAEDLPPLLSAGGGPYDRILLDLSPFGEQVPQHMRALEAHSPNARIVVISGSAASLPESGSRRIYAWVRKPFDIAELLGVVTEPLTHSATQSRRLRQSTRFSKSETFSSCFAFTAASMIDFCLVSSSLLSTIKKS